jgi:hypothetical protein
LSQAESAECVDPWHAHEQIDTFHDAMTSHGDQTVWSVVGRVGRQVV